jgi:3-methyladenine DNA glycosylase Tag
VPKRPTPPERIPRIVENATLSDHLAVITQAVFQAGLSWAFIDARWDRYVAEFDGFDVAKVAAYDEAAVARLMQATDIVHSRAKIEGTIRNARALIEIEREFGSIRAYQTSFAGYDALRRDTAKRFAYLGDMNTYYWLYRTGAPVPDVAAWMKTQGRDHPRIREMVHAASRTNPRSGEAIA